VDVIVHLAANRLTILVIYDDTNVGLAAKLVLALEATNSKAHVIFSSSTPRRRDNLYGKSKRS
jgi:UDP-2-acetamido-2,6-beta-L-arabino-hexul-4-ose reductase